MKVRLRYNVEPHGDLSVIEARAAVFNWLFRHHHHGQIYVRMDDVNFRSSAALPELPEDHVNPRELLTWMGMEWDQGPDKEGDIGSLKASERLEIYQKHVNQLLESKQAYYCYFTKDEIETMYIQQRIHGHKPRYEPGWAKVEPEELKRREEAGEWVSVRLKVPGHVVELVDVVRGKLVYNGPEHSDFVIMRRDGIPTRPFADVVDDHLMNITHVLRDESHKNENPFRGFIANALKFDLPLYVHLPVILGADRSLLSARHGEVSIKNIRALGYMPDALVNYLCNHGWDPGESDTLRTIGSLARNFRVEEIHKTHSTWSQDELDAYNRMAIERIKDATLVDMLVPYVAEAGYDLKARGQGWAESFLAAVRPSLNCLAQVKDSVEMYFAREIDPDKSSTQKLKQGDALKVLNSVDEALQEMEEVKRENYRTLVDAARQAITNRGKALVLTRVLLTGRETGSEFSKLLPLLGKDLIRARLFHMRQYVPKAAK